MSGQTTEIKHAGYATRGRGGDLLIKIRGGREIDAWIPEKDLKVLIEERVPAKLKRNIKGTVGIGGTASVSKSGKGLVFSIYPEGGDYTTSISMLERLMRGNIMSIKIGELPGRAREEGAPSMQSSLAEGLNRSFTGGKA